MPGRFERHKRTSEWYTAPSRSDELRQAASADPEPARKAPARKDTRNWCKGKVGVEHDRALEFRPPVLTCITCEWGSCWDYESASWRCHHQEECRRCGKVLRTSYQLSATECPVYPGSEAQRAEAEAEAARTRARIEANRGRRHPVITGPQGYRRRRQTA